MFAECSEEEDINYWLERSSAPCKGGKVTWYTVTNAMNEKMQAMHRTKGIFIKIKQEYIAWSASVR